MYHNFSQTEQGVEPGLPTNDTTSGHRHLELLKVPPKKCNYQQFILIQKHSLKLFTPLLVSLLFIKEVLMSFLMENLLKNAQMMAFQEDKEQYTAYFLWRINHDKTSCSITSCTPAILFSTDCSVPLIVVVSINYYKVAVKFTTICCRQSKRSNMGPSNILLLDTGTLNSQSSPFKSTTLSRVYYKPYQ